jgi:undecaprenyl pyrophosphate phosphatase UppP
MGPQVKDSANRMSLARPSTAIWTGSAFCAALGLAALVLAALGAGESGTDVALQVTARFSFLLFWPAYTAGALTALFGPAFEPLKRRAREFGLAFASAHLVHLALVAWLTQVRPRPTSRVFFGVAVQWPAFLRCCRSLVCNKRQGRVVFTPGRAQKHSLCF